MYACPQGYPVAVQKTTDAGETWTGTGGLGYNAYGMAVHPTDPNVVYAACGGLYKTTNGGAAWNYVSMPGGSYTRAVVIHPSSPQTVYTTGYAYNGSYQFLGVHKTTDAGATWDTTWLDTLHYSMGYALAMDPSDPAVLYCGGYSGQYTTVFKTTDAGETWSRLYTGYNGYYVYSLHVSPLDPNVVVAGTYWTGILRSTDAGETWTQVSSHQNVKALAAVPDDPTTIYAAGDSLVYVSGDTGRTWSQCSGHAPGYNVGTLWAVASDNVALFTGTKFGIYRSTDAGANWRSLVDDVVYAKVPLISISAADPQTMYIDYKDNAVYKTTDGGVNWSRCPDFLSCGNICGFAFDPGQPDVVWALEGSG
jgi:photosystem II stability/assembly factor-like uncharacterized protein